MKGKIQMIINTLFSSLIIISILGGGIIFIMFLLAIILGGNIGTKLANSASDTVMPYFIQIAAIAIFLGLISIYISKNHTLSLKKPNEEK